MDPCVGHLYLALGLYVVHSPVLMFVKNAETNSKGKKRGWHSRGVDFGIPIFSSLINLQSRHYGLNVSSFVQQGHSDPSKH